MRGWGIFAAMLAGLVAPLPAAAYPSEVAVRAPLIDAGAGAAAAAGLTAGADYRRDRYDRRYRDRGYGRGRHDRYDRRWRGGRTRWRTQCHRQWRGGRPERVCRRIRYRR